MLRRVSPRSRKDTKPHRIQSLHPGGTPKRNGASQEQVKFVSPIQPIPLGQQCFAVAQSIPTPAAMKLPKRINGFRAEAQRTAKTQRDNL